MQSMPGRRRLRRLGALGLLLSGLLGAGTGRTQPKPADPAEAARVIWSSSAGCGDEATFSAELRSRTSRLRAARPGEHATTLIVELMPDAGGVRGQLTVRKANGDLLTREVPGRNCQEVTSAMALIAALMVDPLSRPGSVLVGAKESVAAPPRPRPAGPQWTLRLEQRLQARTAVAPGVASGEALGAMLTWQGQRFRPSLQLSAQAARGTASGAAGSADLRWRSAQATLCPWGAGPGARWDVRGCALVQLGHLQGTGYATANAAKASIAWSAVGVELEGRVKLVGPLWAGVDANLIRPFTHERFFLQPSETLFRVPRWGYGVGAGLGLLFF
jgi:hypothetical protein